MKHIERHTYVLKYCTDKMNLFSLIREIELFKKAWPNATADWWSNQGEIHIWYEGWTLGRELAEGAASDFQQAVKRHEWWEEK